jgi:hypothetical protein
MHFLIDRDFVKEPKHNASFWHELLRNQLSGKPVESDPHTRQVEEEGPSVP